MIEVIAIAQYRSLRELILAPGQLTVVTGANGSGKSNLYRALRLLADIAQGRLVSSLALEGGLQSTLWAGPESFSREVRSGERPVQGGPRSAPLALKLGFGSESFGYAIDVGLPPPGRSAFARDAQIKVEQVWAGPLLHPSAVLVERRNQVLRARDARGAWQTVSDAVPPVDSMLAHFADPRVAPELTWLRDSMRLWRFYDHFRTDAQAPARMPQIGTHTPVLANDGSDLAAALQTIREIGDVEALDAAIEDAFPGARCEVQVSEGRFDLAMHQHGLLRALRGSELSDGTLRYLLWIAALLSPRPAPLLVLNEPETSLHPDLLPALGRLIGAAARRSQVVVVSHASRLVAALEAGADCHSIRLHKQLGMTEIEGEAAIGRPAWRWPARS